jgi:thiosulfate reductase cytochrome b subunit
MSELVTSEVDRAAPAPERVTRHLLVDRLYHWLMAIAVLVLMGTAFLPILGVQFEWIDIHWITGVLLTALVLIHIVRSLLWQDWRNMMIYGSDLREIWRSMLDALRSSAAAPTLPGKYDGLQKLYHLAVAILVLATVVSGLLMLLKIDTPLWRRNPYWLSNDTWGIIYAVHGLAAMALVTMVMLHIYFALRPDEWYLTRSMFRGWIRRNEYREHHDARRWSA